MTDTQRWVSPKEMMEAAKKEMIGGHEPESEKDWYLVMNFAAANIHHKLSSAALELFGMIYDCPLQKEELIEIWDFHNKEE